MQPSHMLPGGVPLKRKHVLSQLCASGESFCPKLSDSLPSAIRYLCASSSPAPSQVVFE